VRLFDSHCHLTWHADTDPPEERVARAQEAGVAQCLSVAVDLASARECRAISQRLPGVHASAGVHPNDVASGAQLDDELRELGELAREGGFVAIGETGLDFYRDSTAATDQERSLHAHLDLAAELDLPVILHCRSAAEALQAALRSRQHPVNGVMHCFSEDVAAAEAFLEMGLHVSFAGNVTYPKSHALREAAAIVPADRLLVETDAPFLAPQPRRGKRNEPAFVRFTLNCLAEVRGVAEEELAEQTFRNATQLFSAKGTSRTEPSA